MELKFPKTVCQYLHAAVREEKHQELTQELRLSDGMPDIGRVLSAWGQVILRSKEWRNDEISFAGGVMAWVLYAPEEGGQPRCMETWVPFQMKWDLGEQVREGDIRIQCLLRFADARSVSARKVMLRLGVGALAEALISQEAQISNPGDIPEDVQLLRAAYPIRLPKEAGEKAFLLDDELPLPGSCPRPEKLVYYTLDPTVSDRKVMGNKVVFRGNGNLHVLYISEEGQLHSCDFELPFSQFADLKGSYTSDGQADVRMCVTSMELELDEESHLRLKCGLLGQYVVDDRELLELVEDAYSPVREAQVQTQLLSLPAILEQKVHKIPAQTELHQNGNQIADSRFLPDFPRQRRNDTQWQWEISGQFQVLYYDGEGTLQSGTARWEGEAGLRADETAVIHSAVLPVQQNQAVAAGDRINLDAEVPLWMQTVSDQGIPMVSGMELSQEQKPDPERPSVILRRAGNDRLWDIAKAAGSTVNAIRGVNHLEQEPEADQILLIPVI